MKKINLLTNLALASTLAGSIAAISSCACKSSDIQITPELDHCSEDVNVKESNIVKYKESTITLTIGDNKEIESIVIICGNKQLVRGTDFKLDGTKITIYANVIDADNVTLVVTTKDKGTILRAKKDFLDKIELFNKDFVNSKLQYKNSDITSLKINGETKSVLSTEYHFEEEDEDKEREFQINYGTGSQESLSPGLYIYGRDYWDYFLEAETVDGVTYEVTDEYVSYKNTKASKTEGSVVEVRFNKYGYYEILDLWADKTGTVKEYREEVTYNGAPTVNSKHINFSDDSFTLTNVIRIDYQNIEVVNENDLSIILEGDTTIATSFNQDVVIKLFKDDVTDPIATMSYKTPESAETSKDIPFVLSKEVYNNLSETKTDTYHFEVVAA